MKTFEIYHLQRTEFRQHPLIQMIMKVNRPLDLSIVEHYTNSKTHELQITDSYTQVSDEQFIKSKCDAVKQAFEEGLYKHVANVKAKTIDKAIVATNNINGYWFMKYSKGVDVFNNPDRSTQSYDLIVFENKLYFVNTLGYLDVEAGCLLKYDKKGNQIFPEA